MIVDGKHIAQTMLDRLGRFVHDRNIQPKLLVLTANPDFATRSFLKIKERAATRVGVVVSLRELSPSLTTAEVKEIVASSLPACDGIILQLPFPPAVDIDEVLRMLPRSHDVDVIGEEAKGAFEQGSTGVLPPVVGAVDAICRAHEVSLDGKRAVVVGAGRLVGAPAATWLRRFTKDVTILHKQSPDIAAHTRSADVLVLGAGVPHFLTPDMMMPGAIIFDAGTSEDGGKLAGDADPACAEKASIFTPVPGGIGPITIAMIFNNLLALRFGYAH